MSLRSCSLKVCGAAERLKNKAQLLLGLGELCAVTSPADARAFRQRAAAAAAAATTEDLHRALAPAGLR